MCITAPSAYVLPPGRNRACAGSLFRGRSSWCLFGPSVHLTWLLQIHRLQTLLASCDTTGRKYDHPGAVARVLSACERALPERSGHTQAAHTAPAGDGARSCAPSVGSAAASPCGVAPGCRGPTAGSCRPSVVPHSLRPQTRKRWFSKQILLLGGHPIPNSLLGATSGLVTSGSPLSAPGGVRLSASRGRDGPACASRALTEHVHCVASPGFLSPRTF